MNRSTATSARLLEGSVGRTLANLTLPMVFGILSMVLYNLADTLFVGWLGEAQLAALSFTFPVVMTVGSLSQGIGMGTSAAVSRAIGAGDTARARRLATDSLILGLVIIAVGVTAGLTSIRPLFSLLGARGEVLDYIEEYMKVWYVGMVFVVVPMIGNNVLRATGDSKTPGLVMVLGATANFILDPLLIFGVGPFPALGVRGAAMATLIGRGATLVIALTVLIRNGVLSGTIPRAHEVARSWGEILHVGVPNAAARMILPIGQGIVTRIVAGFGAAAVAGYGVATRVEFFSLVALNALSSVIGPFVGQNIGAGRIDRVSQAFTVSRRFAIAVGSALFLVYLFLAGAIASIFTDSAEVIATASRYVRIVAIAYTAQGFYLVVSAGLNVLRRPLHAAGLGLLEMFGLMIPLAYLLSRFGGLSGVFAAVAVSYLITGGASWIVINRTVHRERRAAVPSTPRARAR